MSLIDRLFQVNLFGGVKLGLQNALRLQQLLNDPDRSFASIHVAGTNGKGSVSTKIASALREAGYRVGLYTSPHLSCFRERIKINGQMIPEQEVERLLSFLFDLAASEELSPTFFEFTTFLAFLFFAQQQIDVAVIETGLGGRLDATNVIHPLLSIITSISLDHTEVLGSTLEAIAKEKAGIIKPHTPVIIGPHVPREIIQPLADEKQSPCEQVMGQPSCFEEENRLIAYHALQQLASHFNLPPEAIQRGLETKPPCRFEIIQRACPIILDVAHNPDGLTHLFKMVKVRFPQSSLRLLCGLSKSKDLASCASILASQGEHFHLVEATNGRAVAKEALREALLIHHVNQEKIFLHQDIQQAVQEAMQHAAAHKQMLIICGSFFIMNEIRQALGIEEPRDSIDLNEKSIGLIMQKPV